MKCITLVLVFLTCASAAHAAVATSPTTWQIGTLDTLIKFGKPDSMPVISEIRSAGNKWNFVQTTPEAGLSELVSVAGSEPVTAKWNYEGASVKRDSITFTYKCASPRMDAVSVWKSTSLPGPVEHELTVTNKSKDVISLVPHPTTEIQVRVEPGHSLESVWVEKGAGHPSDIGAHVDAVKPDTDTRLLCGPNSHDEPDRDAIPWFALYDAKANRCLYGGIEFSGWTETRLRGLNAGAVEVSMGTRNKDGKTLLRVAPNESCYLPPCFVGVWDGSVDEACNRLHRWVEKHIRPPMPGGVTPLLVNNSWGSGMAVDDKLARTMIDECASLGIEVYQVDAGWYKAVGDWHTHPGKFPQGLESISDYARSKGLKFGLWTAWTQGGALKDYRADTMSVFNPAQKEWFGLDYTDDWKNTDFSGAVICLACRDARDWCLNDLRRCVKDYKIDLLEHDQNMIADKCIRDSHGHTPGDWVDTSRMAAYNYYFVYEQLLKENPNLILEDCYNGGRLVDFGVAKRTHYFCATDTYRPVPLRRAFYDASYPFPPSMVEAYIGNHPGETLANFKYMLRSGMMGWCTVMLDTSKWTQEQRQAGKRCFEVYKTKLRPLIAAADVYHVLPRATENGWDGMQYFDPKTGKGALYVFRTDTPEAIRTVLLRGLDASRKYRLSCEDGSIATQEATGRELMEKGVTVTLPEIRSSDLVFFDEWRK